MPDSRRATIALLAGPLLAAVLYGVLPVVYMTADGVATPLPAAARGTLALTACMAVWWLFEAVPVAVTALVPVTVFPLFGLHRLEPVAAAYAHPLIFLFFGGFLLSIAIEKWRLHTWIAERVIAVAGSDPRRLVGAFMLVTAATSMWLSNTATALMMLPIAASAIATLDRAAGAPQPAFAICLLLGVAYGASIGGMGTLIGSPPNLFVASFLAERFGYVLDFRGWMAMALPLVVVLLPLVWWLLTRILVPVDPALRVIVTETRVPWRALPRGARRVSWVFLATVAAWMFRATLNDWTVCGRAPLAALTDTGVALGAALLLFILPAGDGTRLLGWNDAERLPLGTLLLFGGGLALAATITATGADAFIGAQLAALRAVPWWVVVLTVTAAVVFLTELTSNTATTTTLAPILAAAALANGFDVLGIIVATALGASAAFMLPVATPPNAIVFGSGRLPAASMARAGVVVNVVAILVILPLVLWWVPRVLPALQP